MFQSFCFLIYFLFHFSFRLLLKNKLNFKDLLFKNKLHQDSKRKEQKEEEERNS